MSVGVVSRESTLALLVYETQGHACTGCGARGGSMLWAQAGGSGHRLQTLAREQPEAWAGGTAPAVSAAGDLAGRQRGTHTGCGGRLPCAFGSGILNRVDSLRQSHSREGKWGRQQSQLCSVCRPSFLWACCSRLTFNLTKRGPPSCRCEHGGGLGTVWPSRTRSHSQLS